MTALLFSLHPRIQGMDNPKENDMYIGGGAILLIILLVVFFL